MGRRAGEIDSPIITELAHMLARDVMGDVVLIDDAREFTGHDGYPTLDALRDQVRAVWPLSRVLVEHDCIHILPSTV